MSSHLFQTAAQSLISHALWETETKPKWVILKDKKKYKYKSLSETYHITALWSSGGTFFNLVPMYQLIYQYKNEKVPYYNFLKILLTYRKVSLAKLVTDHMTEHFTIVAVAYLIYIQLSS